MLWAPLPPGDSCTLEFENLCAAHSGRTRRGQLCTQSLFPLPQPAPPPAGRWLAGWWTSGRSSKHFSVSWCSLQRSEWPVLRSGLAPRPHSRALLPQNPAWTLPCGTQARLTAWETLWEPGRHRRGRVGGALEAGNELPPPPGALCPPPRQRP